MTYLLSHYWGWLAVVAALGFLGAKSTHGEKSSNRPKWFYVAAVLLALGGIADVAHVLNGRPALWLETGILSFGAFLLGGQAGAPGRLGGHLWGAFLVAGLVWICSIGMMQGPTETALKAIAGDAATGAGGNALDDKAAADKAAAEKAAAEKMSEDKAATPSLVDKKAAAIAAAKGLPETGPLGAAQCQTALSGLAASENVKFETGSAKVSDDSKALISRINATLARCAETKIEIAGHTDSVGDASTNKTLSQRRAEAVADLLKSGGASAARLTAIGYGQEKPLASNDTAEGRAENRRIEFVVK
jgi:outer membrane protein OmpA-like peptidoglycan-associated protein